MKSKMFYHHLYSHKNRKDFWKVNLWFRFNFAVKAEFLLTLRGLNFTVSCKEKLFKFFMKKEMIDGYLIFTHYLTNIIHHVYYKLHHHGVHIYNQADLLLYCPVLFLQEKMAVIRFFLYEPNFVTKTWKQKWCMIGPASNHLAGWHSCLLLNTEDITMFDYT